MTSLPQAQHQPQQPSSNAAAKKGWGSLFNNAVATLESRLDTILADAEDVNVIATPPTRSSAQGSREASRTRAVNDRLAERLAKATAAKGAGVVSHVGVNGRDTTATTTTSASSVPLNGASAANGRVSIESTRSRDDSRPPQISAEEKGTLLTSSVLPINPARHSQDNSNLTIDTPPQDVSARTSLDSASNNNNRYSSDLGTEDTSSQQHAHLAGSKQQQEEEMQTHLAHITALQSKLHYLATETVAAAKLANGPASSSLDDSSNKAKLAEKDSRIALLMDEGEELSKTELKHAQTIKRLRGKAIEDDKTVLELVRKLERAERTEADAKLRLKRAEAAERLAIEKAKEAAMGRDRRFEELRVEREKAAETIQVLNGRVAQAEADTLRLRALEQGLKAEKEAIIAGLENELEDARIEKRLAEDRTTAEATKRRQDADANRERELELTHEIARLEARLEAVRSRAEEAYGYGSSSDAAPLTEGESTGGSGVVKLLRQVEMLQQQYSLAKDNWAAIEASLQARTVALEAERDEAGARESDLRRRAREARLRCRRAEEEVEAAAERSRGLTTELVALREECLQLRQRAESAQTALEEIKAESERERRRWEAEMVLRLQEEKTRWLQQEQHHYGHAHASPAPSSGRKPSSAENLASRKVTMRKTERLTPRDLSALYTSSPVDLPPRRTSSSTSFTPHQHSSVLQSPPTEFPPSLSRQASDVPNPSQHQRQHLQRQTFPPPPTPSLEISHPDRAPSPRDNSSLHDLISHSASARGTPSHDLLSNVSTAAAASPAVGIAGPSVQLVERMSAAVRRLESEKAALRDEMARLAAQRDGAREEVVKMLREAAIAEEDDGNGVGGGDKDVGGRAVAELRRRYEACLEMLGEREEEVGELRQDVGTWKGMYRRLVEEKMGPTAAATTERKELEQRGEQ